VTVFAPMQRLGVKADSRVAVAGIGGVGHLSGAGHTLLASLACILFKFNSFHLRKCFTVVAIFHH
jgi:D-arabinose 1-dehydrogenase-like Zn-dependent alcohol dehydrogenase